MTPLLRLLLALPLAVALLADAGRVAAQTVEVSLYCPVVVGGPVTRVIEHLVGEFEQENPGIKIRPVYTGSYQETITKALAMLKSSERPQAGILLSADIHTLIDADAILPWDDFIRTDGDRAWIGGFFPAFMQNSRAGGKTWGIPFQRSTIVLYWNKEAFRAAGLDPTRAPATRAEQAEFARRLTRRDAAGRVTQWGIQVPSTGYAYWLFQGLTTQNDVLLMNDAGTHTYFDTPAAIEALQYWVDLAATRHAMAPGLVDWATTSRDFLERRTAMMRSRSCPRTTTSASSRRWTTACRPRSPA